MKRLSITGIILLLGLILGALEAEAGEGKVFDNIYVEHNVVKDGKRGLNVVTGVEFVGMAGKEVEITADITRVVNGTPKSTYSPEKFITVVPESGIIPYVSFFIPTEGLPDAYYKAHLDVYDLSVNPKKRIGHHQVRDFYLNDEYRKQPVLDWSGTPKMTIDETPLIGVKQSGGTPVPLTLNKWSKKLGSCEAGNSLSATPTLDEGLNPLTVNGQTRVVFRKPIFRIYNQRYSRSGNDLVITFNIEREPVTFPDLENVRFPGVGLGVWAGLYKGMTPVMAYGKKVHGFQNFGNVATQQTIRDVQVRIPLNDVSQEMLDSKLHVALWPYIYNENKWNSAGNIWGPLIEIPKLPGAVSPSPKPQPSPQPQPKPKPTPSVSKPVLTWIQCPATSSGPTLNLKVGVKSGSTITGYKVLVNGSEARGIKAVRNDGYDLMIDRTVTLAQGENRITISVTNAGGTLEESRTVTYGSTDTPKPLPKPSPKPAVVTPVLKKIALVVGNGAYPEQPLRNTLNDASAVARRLRNLGFEVVYASDATKKQLDQTINDFGTRAARYDVAMFYYAGHGIQHNGDNYLVPVDATLHSESDVTYECTNVNRLLDKLEDSGVKMKIVALDACRNNPFERSWHRSAGGARGLSAINAPVGTFISYATSPGNVAADGSGTHSPYTDALLKALDEKDLSIEGVFRQVGANVTKATGRAQTPWYASSLYEGNFIFNPSK